MSISRRRIFTSTAVAGAALAAHAAGAEGAPGMMPKPAANIGKWRTTEGKTMRGSLVVAKPVGM